MNWWSRLAGTRISCAILRAHRACAGLPCDCACHDLERIQRRIIEREMALYGEVLSRSLLDDPKLRSHVTLVRLNQQMHRALRRALLPERPNPSVREWR